MGDFLLPKTARLKSKKDITFLFTKGNSIFNFPIKTNYSIEENGTNSLVFSVNVSKKNFTKAHDRNRIKRLLRESVRLNKKELNLFLNENNKCIKAMFVYVGKEMPDFALIDKKIILTLHQLKTINEQSS